MTHLTKVQKVVAGAGIAGLVTALVVKAAKVCTPGETKCVGFDLYECSPECKWVLVEANSPACEVRYGVITGKVTDDQGIGLQYANITADGNSVQADADGEYYIRLPVGIYTVTFSKPLYITETREVKLTPEKIVTLDITLQGQPEGEPAVRWMGIVPAIAAVGETVKISCECICYTPGTYSIDCTINGTVMTKNYTFSETKVWDDKVFLFIPTAVGTYSVTILGVTQTLEVVEEAVGILACPKCGSPAGTDAELVEHMMNCFTFWGDPSSAWSYTLCPYCGEEFGEYDLWGWMPQHEVIIRKLIGHIKSSHPLICPYCGVDFTFAGCAPGAECTEGRPRLEVLQDHMRDVHDIVPIPPEVTVIPVSSGIVPETGQIFESIADMISPTEGDRFDIGKIINIIKTSGMKYASKYPGAAFVEGPMYVANYGCEADIWNCPTGGLPYSGFKAIIPDLDGKDWACTAERWDGTSFIKITSVSGNGSMVKFRLNAKGYYHNFNTRSEYQTVHIKIEYDDKVLLILHPLYTMSGSGYNPAHTGAIVPGWALNWLNEEHQETLADLLEMRDFLTQYAGINLYGEQGEKQNYYAKSWGLGTGGNYTASQVYAAYNSRLAEENEHYNSWENIYEQLKAKYDANWGD
ncbi:MAG TPA: carboxypeptidase-like regulatory domain-containing protein [Dehalococcoidia bacterium]|nr:carboxypeptidase-like regulatory domain-containing protein [Dehalococcoidia bacterium]